MESISFLPLYSEIFWVQISQTLFASIISTVLFLLFTGIYLLVRKWRPKAIFVGLIDYGIEGITKFFMDMAGHISSKVIIWIVFLFIYILRNNLRGLVGDLVVLAAPQVHYYFRPVSTDIFFNLTLAGMAIIGSMIYGFSVHKFHYITKYIWYKGMGIVPKVTWVVTFIAKIFDIIIGLFLGIIEIAGEVSKMLSLSLRLFWNILAGMVLLGLIVSASMAIMHVPFALPLIVIFFELFVGFLQAFVFSMLVLVYFKIAEEHH